MIFESKIGFTKDEVDSFLVDQGYYIKFIKITICTPVYHNDVECEDAVVEGVFDSNDNPFPEYGERLGHEWKKTAFNLLMEAKLKKLLLS